MAQVSYGTITIIDTNDIERIYLQYCRSTDNQLTNGEVAHQTVSWQEATPPWVNGQYIWQRSVIKKSGVNTLTYGVPVCLTGAQGQTGSSGQSLTATKTQYTHVASNVTITTSNHTSYKWTDNVPEYDSTKPVYWGRITNTYTNSAKTEYLVYKDNGLTDAIAQSVEANANASEALDKANEAESIAQQTIEDSQGAMSQAAAANVIAQGLQSQLKYMWTNQVNSVDYPAGSYMASGNDSTFSYSDSSTYGFNSFLQHTKIHFRYNAIDLNTLGLDGLKLYAPTITNDIITGSQLGLELTKDALKFYRPGTAMVDAQLTSSGLQITNGSITLGSNFAVNSSGSLTAKSGTIGGITIGTSYLTTNSSRTTYDATTSGITLTTSGFGAGNGSANTFYVQASTGKLYATNADIKGIIKADTGYIGGTSGWTIAAQQIYSTNHTIGTNDSMFLSTKNLAGTVAGKELTANSPSWRFTVGSNFGVDNTGKLYASGAEISGKIIVSENSGSNVYTTDEVDDNFATQESIPTSVNELEDIDTYATKQEVSNVDNFVKSHIEIDGSTMSLVADSTDVLSKLVMSVNGLSLCGTDGKSLAEYGEDAIIGKRDSFHIRIVTSNSDPDLNGIFFYQGENPVAYINGNRLYISQSVVLQQMDVGTPMNNGTGGQWSWKVHPVDNKNNLYLKWLG